MHFFKNFNSDQVSRIEKLVDEERKHREQCLIQKNQNLQELEAKFQALIDQEIQV